MKTKIIMLLIVVSIFATNAWADIHLDIDTAVERAVENNLSLERERANVDAAKRKSNRSWNSLLPSVSVGAAAMKPTSITNEIVSPADEWKTGFSLQTGITLSPAVLTNIEQTKVEYEAGLLNYESARQNLDYQVRTIFYQLLSLDAAMDLAEQTAASAQRNYEETLARRNLGQASNLDELSARLDAENQKLIFHNSQTSYENALDNLKNLLMIPQEEKVILEGSFPIFDENANVNIGEASIISSESLSTGTVRKSIEVLEAQKKNAQTSFYAPSLNVSWNSSPLYSDSTDKWTDASGQLSITLSMKLDNLLPWSSAKENIDTINDAITQQKSLLRESNLNHQNTLYKLRRNITQSANTLETLKLNITLAEETLASYEESYQRGTSDFQTLNTARDNVQAAQNKLLSEQYNLALSILELEKEINVPFGSLLGNE